MRMVDIIHKKRFGGALSTEEIAFFINGYTAGHIPDYQASSLLMAICFQGMTEQETADLTMAMVRSGDRIDLSAIEGIKVDKHSTGGVGDKVSLIAGPLAAAAGIPVAKMSGRGLGHTGGTVDKLESIPGFQIELTKEQFISNVNRIKFALASQTGNLAPADKKLYALRDVTGTVESIPLIASSIMSKKIASGADGIVLDVKVGKGAFMKTIEEARKLAQTMVQIGEQLGKQTSAVITDMNQPLGREIGNALEVKEAIEVLKGNGSRDLIDISLTVAAHMTVLGGAYKTVEEAYLSLEQMLKNGKALAKLGEFIASQGGDASIIEDSSKLPKAGRMIDVKADHSGYVAAIDAESIGVAAMMLGAGRQTKDDQIDYSAGMTLMKKIGDRVTPGDTLCVLHTNVKSSIQAESLAQNAFIIDEQPPKEIKHIYDIVM